MLDFFCSELQDAEYKKLSTSCPIFLQERNGKNVGVRQVTETFR